MRARAIAIVAATLITPATAYGACPVTPDAPRYSARANLSWQEPYYVHSSVVLCDHRAGRARVLARGRWRRSAPPPTPRSPAGRLLGSASAARGRVAWIEAQSVRRPRRGGYRVFARVVVQAIRSGRLLRRFVVQRETNADPFSSSTIDLPNLGVVLTQQGDLAWLSGDEVTIDPARGRRFTFGRDARPPLLLEDGGTLVWMRPFTLGSYELYPPPVVDGCPRRERYTPVFSSAELLVTEVSYRHADGSEHLRACLRGAGRDVVVASAFTFFGDGASLQGVTGSAGRVAYATVAGDRYIQCDWQVRVVDVATLGVVRSGRMNCLGAQGPFREQPFVLTTAGAPAWVSRFRYGPPDGGPPDGPSLLTIAADGRVVELDRGDIANLRAEGEDVVWTNGGVPRRARP